MSPGIVKGLLVTMIVFGFESILFGVCFLFRRDGRRLSAKTLVQGTVQVVIFSVAFLLFERGYFLDEFSPFLLFLGYPVILMTIEAVFRRSNLRALVSPEPITSEDWPKQRITKRQFVLFVTLAFAWFLVTPAIVFTIVAPEVLPVYWWPILIILLSLIGFVFAWRYWNANEKKFGSQVPFPQPK